MSKDDGSMQLPSWDDVDGDQLDYDEDVDDTLEGGGEEGDDPGDPVDEPGCSTAPAVAASASAPERTRPVPRDGRMSAPSRTLRPPREWFLNPDWKCPDDADLSDFDDDDNIGDVSDMLDPEDPDDPGTSVERDGGAASGDDAPTLPSVPSSIVGPSLPLDELPPDQTGSSSASMPPPEPTAPRRVAAPAPPRVAATAASARVIGPAMPPDLPFEANGVENGHGGMNGGGEGEGDDDDDDDDEAAAYGPAPPPAVNGGGPSGDRNASAPRELEMPTEDGSEDEDDDDVIGPMPAAASGADERAAERRRAALAHAQALEASKVKREEWMLQLPKKLNNYGLGARTFSKSSGGPSKTEQSEWTRAPTDERSEDQPGTSRDAMMERATADRDASQARVAQQLNANRAVSMLDAHTTTRKRKADGGAVGGEAEEEEDGMIGGRRPFDRERDMQVKGFKSASKAKIKEKCGQLSSRFGNSGQRFL